MGTATAALRADEHERLWHDLSVTVTPPVALLAALVAVPEAAFELALPLLAPGVADVANVVDTVDVAEEAAPAAVELGIVEELSPSCWVAGPLSPFVKEYSLAIEEAKLPRSAVPGGLDPVMPWKVGVRLGIGVTRES